MESFPHNLWNLVNIRINILSSTWISRISPLRRCRKSIWQNPTSSYDTNSQHIGYRRYLNIIKALFDKPTVNSLFNSERLKVLPVGAETREEWLFSPENIQILLEVSDISIRQEKELEVFPNQKGRSKTVSVCWWHNLWWSPKDSTHKLLELINKISKVSGYQINV